MSRVYWKDKKRYINSHRKLHSDEAYRKHDLCQEIRELTDTLYKFHFQHSSFTSDFGGGYGYYLSTSMLSSISVIYYDGFYF